MRRRRNGSMVLWSLLGALLVACSARSAQVKTAPPKVPPRDAWAWMDAEAMVMGEVSLAALRDTPVFALVHSARGAALDDTSWVDLDRVDRVVFSGTEDADGSVSFVAAVDGRFDDGYVAGALGAETQPVVRGPLSFYRRGDLYWAQVYPELLVGCTEDRLEQLAVSYTKTLRLAKESGLYTSLAPRLSAGAASVLVLVNGNDPPRRKLIDRTVRQSGVGLGGAEVQRAGVALSFGQTVGLRVLAELPSDEQATRLAALTQSQLDAAAGNLLLAMFGLRPLLSAVQVSSLEHAVQLQAELPRNDLFNVLSKLKNLVEMGGAFRAGGAAAAP